MKLRTCLIVVSTALFSFLPPFLLAGLALSNNQIRAAHAASVVYTEPKSPIPAKPELWRWTPVTTTTTTTTTTAPPPPPPPPPVPALPSDYWKWTKVSICENGPGAWNPPKGSAYPDSLGISAANWWANGGGSLDPAAQIAVADRIEAKGGAAGFVPDQNGCASW